MDFSQFDSRSAAEKPQELHLQDPVTGAPLYDGDQPCVVMVLGVEGKTVSDAIKRIEKLKMNGDAQSAADADVETRSLVGPMIAGFKSGIHRGDKLATLSDVEWFLMLQKPMGAKNSKSFLEQIMDFSMTRGNFLGNASKP